jgi:hypothetical protein
VALAVCACTGSSSEFHGAVILRRKERIVLAKRKRTKIEPLVTLDVLLTSKEIALFTAYGKGDESAGMRKFLDEFEPQITEILERERRRGHN